MRRPLPAAVITTAIGTMKPELNSIDEVQLDQLNQRLERLCVG
jgi:hypothetical protein